METSHTDFKYDAFVAAAPGDRKWACRIRDDIRAYRLPHALVGATTGQGIVPARVGSVYCEPEEAEEGGGGLPAEEALHNARHLIIVCSPEAVQSGELHARIVAFHLLGRFDNIVGCLVSGEPNLLEVPGSRKRECLPMALRHRLDEQGELTNEPVDPPLADFRRSGARRERATLELVAGLTGLNPREIRFQEARRQLRQFRIMTPLAILLAAGFLAFGIRQWTTHRSTKAKLQTAGEANIKAYTAARKALDTGKLARQRHRDVSVRLANLAVARGWREFERGDDSLGLLWHVEALKILHEGARIDPEGMSGELELERIRLGQVFGFLPMLETVVEAVPGARFTAFSSNGRLLVTTGGGGHARVWDATTGAPKTAPLPHGAGDDGSVDSAVFTGNGGRVLTVTLAGNVRVWDVESGRLTAGPLKAGSTKSEPDRRPTTQATFSPDGAWVLTHHKEEGSKLWDATTGDRITRFEEKPKDESGDEEKKEEDKKAEGEKEKKPVEKKPVWIGLSPDGKRLVLAGGNSLKVFETASGKPACDPLPVKGTVAMTVFSPDGGRILSVSSDSTATIWEIETGKPVAPAMKHPAKVWFGAFSGDGRRIATLCGTGTIRVWDAETGKDVSPDPIKTGEAHSLTLNRDGSLLYVYDQHGKISTVWDVETISAASLGESEPVPGAVHPSKPDVCGIANGATVFLREWKHAAAWSPPLRHAAPVSFLVFGPKGERLATLVKEGGLRVWKLHSRQPEIVECAHDSPVTRAVFAPGAPAFLTAGEGGVATLWNSKTGMPAGQSLIHEVPESQPPEEEKNKPSDPSDKSDKSDKSDESDESEGDNEEEAEPGVTDSLSTIAFNAGGSRIVTSFHNYVRVWDASTGTPHGKPVNQDGWTARAIASEDGSDLLVEVVSEEKQEVRVFSLPDGELRFSAPCTYAAFSPDGRRFLTETRAWENNGDETASIWSVEKGAVAQELSNQHQPVVYAAFNRNAEWLATSDSEGRCRLWRLADDAEPAPRDLPHPGEVHLAAFSPDSRFLVTATHAGKAARIWDTATGELVAPPFTHHEEITHLRFDPEGKRLATTTRDHRLRVWDIESGLALTPLLMHNGAPIMDIRFDPADPAQLVTIGNDIRRWNLTPDPRPPQQMQQQAQLVSARKIDAAGNVVPLSPTQLRQIWIELQEASARGSR